MRVLFVYQDERLPSSRIRILQMAEYLRDTGIDVECLRFPRSLGDTWNLVGRSAEFGAVVLQKKLPALAHSVLLRRLAACRPHWRECLRD